MLRPLAAGNQGSLSMLATPMVQPMSKLLHKAPGAPQNQKPSFVCSWRGELQPAAAMLDSMSRVTRQWH